MKPIIVIILALPITVFVHHTDHNKTVVPHVKTHVVADAQNKPSASPVVTKTVNIPAPAQKAAVAAPVAPQPQPSAVAPPTTPTVYTSGCSNYQSTFAQYSWDVSVAMAICEAESSGNPNAVSSTADYGLMQIHDGLSIYGSKIFDPYLNISIAYIKYQTQGWEAWSTYNSGAYREYL